MKKKSLRGGGRFPHTRDIVAGMSAFIPDSAHKWHTRASTTGSVRHIPAVDICLLWRTVIGQEVQPSVWTQARERLFTWATDVRRGLWGRTTQMSFGCSSSSCRPFGAFVSRATLKMQAPATLKGSFWRVCCLKYVFITIPSWNCLDQWWVNQNVTDLFTLSCVEVHRAVVKWRPALTARSELVFPEWTCVLQAVTLPPQDENTRRCFILPKRGFIHAYQGQRFSRCRSVFLLPG